MVEFISDRIPGKHLRRHLTLADGFCDAIPRRELDLQTDYIHIVENFQESHNQCWLIIDFNSSGDLKSSDVNDIPLSYFKTGYTPENL